MKKSSTIFVISFLCLILCGVLVLLFIKFFDVDSEIKLTEKKYGVISKENIKAKDVSLIDDTDYLIIHENNKCGVMDINGNLIIDIEYDTCLADRDNIIVNDDKNYYLINNKGETLIKSENSIEGITDLLSNVNYYLVNVAKDKDAFSYEIYDGKFNLIYKLKSKYENIFIVGNYIVLHDEIINFETDEVSKIVDKWALRKYYVFELADSGYILYNSNTKESTYYEKMTENYGICIFENGDNKLIVDYEGNILSNASVEVLNDKYKLDYSLCNMGAKILNSEGEELYNECYVLLSKDLLLKYGYFFVLDTKNDKKYLLYDDKKIEISSNDSYEIGEFVATWDSEMNKEVLYNRYGRKVDNVCNSSFYEIGDGKYLCSDLFDNYYIVDSDMKSISKTYDYLYCNDKSVCVFKDSKDLFGIIINDEVVSEASYYNAIMSDNKILLETIDGYVLLNLGYGDTILGNDELKYVLDFPYDEIIIEDVIDEYNLDNIEDLIYDNEDLFKRYAYIVLNNKNLKGYEKYVLEMFNVVIDNKDVLNEKYLLYGLYNLDISLVDSIDPEWAAGTYNHNDKKINLLQPSSYVIRHELMHFLDFNLEPKKFNYIYDCGNHLYIKENLSDLSDEILDTCKKALIYDETFVSEAGAEYNMVRYTDDFSMSYSNGMFIYYLLSYLFGDEFMKDVYFDAEGYYLLYEKLSKYMKLDDFDNFISLANVVTRYDTNKNSSDYIELFNIMKGLCKDVLSKEWYEDKTYKTILSLYVDYNNIDKMINNNDAGNLIDSNIFLDSLLGRISKKYSIYSPNVNVTKNKEITYIDMAIYVNDDLKLFRIKYDIENDVIKDSKIISDL